MTILDPLSPEQTAVTMSFLLTDIEDSTGHWQRAGQRFREALEAHHRLLRRETVRRDGRELTEAGDGFLIAFQEPRAAADCAIALQQALANEGWPAAVGAVRVRMVLHCGPVEPLASGEFRGVTLNRAARLRDGAHGGQIICSASFAEALAGRVELRELGLFRLRGLPAPERVWQLCWPEMAPQEFPRLRLAPAFTNNLPPAFTRFFGREREVQSLRAWILEQRERGISGARR